MDQAVENEFGEKRTKQLKDDDRSKVINKDEGADILPL